MKTKDIMHKHLITVSPEMNLKELAHLFVEKQISGAPVVDHNDNLVGIISQTDLARHYFTEMAPDVSTYHSDPEEFRNTRGFHIESPDFTSVKEVMTPGAISFEEETPLKEIAETMLKKHIHRVLITKNGRLTGIVTTMDMLKALLEIASKWEAEVIPS